MKRAWIVGLCLVLLGTGCSRGQAVSQPEPEVRVEEEEVIEVKVVDDLPEEAYKRVKYRVQEELMVFDASRFDDGLMASVREVVLTGMDRSLVKEVIEETLSGYMDLWKREIVTERLEFLVGEYSRNDFEKLMQDTSNKQIKDMVVAYVLEKLIQEGYQFD